MSYSTFSDYYDPLTANVDHAAMADFISVLLKEIKPDCSLVADLACGTGSISVCLDKLGFDVIGVDISPEMLAVAKEKSPSDILYLCQPLDELDLFGTIDAAICCLDSINHIIDEDELEEAFRRISLFLEPDGVFIFDVNTEHKHKNILADNSFVYELDDVFCVWQNSTDEELFTDIFLDFFIREGNLYHRKSEQFTERAYSVETLTEMLLNNGLKIAAIYDGYSKKSPHTESERLVFVCIKDDQ